MLDFPAILALILMESSKQRKQQTCDQQLSYNQINVINPNFIAPLLHIQWPNLSEKSIS